MKPARPGSIFPALVVMPALVVIAAGFFPAAAQSGVTDRLSVDSSGAEAGSLSDMSAISADGRFVAFASNAANLVPGDANGVTDVFVHDRRTGRIERVSIDSRGRQGNDNSGLVGVSGYPAISADGRFVAFPSDATNLVSGDTNGTTDVFVRDRQAGTTTRVSVSGAGAESDGFSDGPALSADGRFVAFRSSASNLVSLSNGFPFLDQIYVHDRLTGTTEIASVDESGVEGNGSSFRPDISPDGRFVVFSSSAGNLVPGLQLFHQVFLRDRLLETTERVSEDAAGAEGDGTSSLPVVSADGRFVAFQTNAANLIGDGVHESHIVLRDRLTGAFERVSVDDTESAADLPSEDPDMTPDGRFVTFFSLATNLVPGDGNDHRDIFVRDLQAGTTERVSVSTAGMEGDSESTWPRISDDGLVVAFSSTAGNLEDGNSTGDVLSNDRRPAADLTLATSDSPDPAAPRAALTYMVTVVNNGPAEATEAVMTHALPAGASFVSASASQGSCARGRKGKRAGPLTCALGTIPNGGSATVTIVVVPARPGTLTSTATARASQPDSDRTDNSATTETTVF